MSLTPTRRAATLLAGLLFCLGSSAQTTPAAVKPCGGAGQPKCVESVKTNKGTDPIEPPDKKVTNPVTPVKPGVKPVVKPAVPGAPVEAPVKN